MSAETYSFTAKLLHRLALGSRAIAEASMDIDRMLAKPECRQILQSHPVYVSGLARAGTTLIMRRLHATGQFRSLTYRDMPFVLMPNLWRAVTKPFDNAGNQAERAHGDGLTVDCHSPEALEEVFWRICYADRYIQPDRLVPMTTDPQMTTQYAKYIASILHADDHPNAPRRYLAKNNNQMLRLNVICQTFEHATVLIPFRNPIDQAQSLLRQHERFCQMAAKDPFVGQYMTWLAHHEFGPDHRPYVFNDDSPPKPNDPHQLNYWITLWIQTYRYMLQQHNDNCIWIDYHRLCNNPKHVFQQLGQRIDCQDLAQAQADPVTPRTAQTPTQTPDTRLAGSAGELYRQLLIQMNKWYTPPPTSTESESY